jgi:hypothetical protein
MTMTMTVILAASIGAIISVAVREMRRESPKTVVDHDDFEKGWAEGYAVAKSEARRDYQIGYDEGYFAAQEDAPKKAVRKVKTITHTKEK